MIAAGNIDPANLNPSLTPLSWPTLPLLPTVGILVGVLPAWLAPPVASPARATRGRARVAVATAPSAPVAADAAPSSAPVRVP
jgi:energy-coupling factor transport system permease protein